MPSKPLKYQYEEEDDVKMKVEKIATQIYGAMKVTYLPLAFKKLKMIETKVNLTSVITLIETLLKKQLKLLIDYLEIAKQ